MAGINNDSQLDIDDLLGRLLDGLSIYFIFSMIFIFEFLFLFFSESGNHRLNKFVKMSEQEMHLLCEKSIEIFLNQPMLLELEASIKICGNIIYQLSI